MVTKVYIDPACNINYSSFYLIGLREVYGKRNIVFTSRYFKDLHYSTDCHYLAFVIEGKKYIIDFADSNKLFSEEFLQWADVYGKLNYNKDSLPIKYTHKIKHVGANFGIACYGTNKYQALLWSLWHYTMCYNRLKYPFGSFLSPYLWVYKRKIVKSMPTPIGSKIIFMVSRYWKGQDDVNRLRINFIRACKRLDNEGLIIFIGGMVPDYKEHDCPRDVLLDHEMPFDEYVKGLHNSLLVFNTPAYHNCHGWKLPEYMSQGKIILSTPFINELPVSMEHGQNIFFTDTNEQAIYEGIKEIVGNLQLQKKLEKGCVTYWQQYANPTSCVKCFIDS